MKLQKAKLNLVLLLFVHCLFFLQANAQYAMNDYVFGNGGGIISGSSNRITGILGQPAIGITGTTENRISSGFWRKTESEPTNLKDITNTQGFRLDQNFPNPFRLSTTIKFTLHGSSSVAIRLYDMQGREIMTLVNARLPLGDHTVTIHARDISAGAYIYRLESEGLIISRKLNVLK